MRKPLSAGLVVVTLVALCAVSVRTANGAPASGPKAGSSMVVVAVDATPQSNCQETLHINTGWHTTPPPGAAPLVAATRTISCPAGTILKTAQVALTQALAQHEAYAQMPANPQKPTAAERAALHALLDAKHQSLATGQSATAVQPLTTTACGATGSGSLQWTADGVGFYSTVHWFKYNNPDCGWLFLDDAYLGMGYSSSVDDWGWGSDAYYNDRWFLNFGPLQSYGHQEYYPNMKEPTNHWYRQYVDETYVPYSTTTIWQTYIAICN